VGVRGRVWCVRRTVSVVYACRGCGCACDGVRVQGSNRPTTGLCLMC